MIYKRVISSAHRAMNGASDGLDVEESLFITHLSNLWQVKQIDIQFCFLSPLHVATC